MTKKISLTLLLSLFIISSGMAQITHSHSNPLLKKGKAIQKYIANASKYATHKKTRAQDLRLIAETYEENVILDSSTFSYSGFRGSPLEAPYFVFFENINFDNSAYYDFGSTPNLQIKTNRTYNTNNQVLVQIDSFYLTSFFDPGIRITNAYNSNNLLISTLDENWNGASWINSSKKEYSYNAGNVIQDVSLDWNGVSWDSSGKNEYTYTANMLSTETEYYYLANAWVPTEKRVITYNSNNQILTEAYQAYTSNTWVNSRKDTLTYNSNNEVIEVLTSNWMSNQWEKEYRSLISWVNNRATVVESQDWNTTSLSWDNYEKYNYTYNSNKYITSEEALSWDGTSYVYDATKDSYRSNYYYETYNNNVGLQDKELALMGVIKTYPNPTADLITVQWNKKPKNNLEFYIIDMNGKIVSTQYASGADQSITISLQNLAKGNYVLNIKSANENISNQIIAKY